jgi:hypothetical protein
MGSVEESVVSELWANLPLPVVGRLGARKVRFADQPSGMRKRGR